MAQIRWRSPLGLLVWIGLLVAVAVLHHVQPPAELALSGSRWNVTGIDPPVVVVPGVTLPHRWHAFVPAANAVRYETTFELAAVPAESRAIYIPSSSMAAVVAVNGTQLGDDFGAREILARHSYRPLLFRLPANLLRGGANEIAIEIRSVPAGSGFLQQVYFGPLSALQPFFDLRHFLKFQFHVGLIVAVAVLGTIMWGVWLARRAERVYLWYALCSLTFFVYAIFIAATHLPLPALWWDCLQRIAIMWMIASITVFSFAFIGLSRPRVATGLGWIATIGPAVLVALGALLPPEWFYVVLIRVWLNAVLGFGVYPVVLFVHELRLRRDERTFWMTAAGSSLLVVGAHDVLFENGLIAPYNGFYFHYAIPLALVVFTSILGGRFLNALRESEILNRELNDRVRQKEAELQRTYEDLKRAEQQRLLADERERIQRDMHDGLGGTLVSTLAGLDLQGEQESAAAQSLRSALDDLRLMIYSLDQDSATLRAALGMLRERIERLADDAGLGVEWCMRDLPADLALEHGATLQVMRIVQEAFTNTVKHAHARTFSLTATRQASGDRAGVTLDMHDDGRGFDVASVTAGGYGLSNMRVRAQKLGGQLEFAAAAAGTRITLWVPAG